MTAGLPFETMLFDVDGTLVDSNGAHAAAWAQALRDHGVPAHVAQIRPLIGMGGDKLLPATASVRGDSDLGRAITKRKKEIFATLLSGLSPTKGARALLECLRHHHVTLAIATSADDDEVTALLQRAGVDDLIPRRAKDDDSQASKPDPDVVRAALAGAGARPERAVLIGDTPYDIEAARRAHIPAIALRCGGYWTDDDLFDAVDIHDDPAALLAHWRERARTTRAGLRSRRLSAAG